MTIQELITKVQEEKPNSFQNAKVVQFVNEIEADVAEQLNVNLPTYTTSTLSAELLAPRPYDRLYVSYVKAMIDYANEEYGSYQLNQAQHMQDFQDFIDWIVRSGQVEFNPAFPGRFSNVF